METPFRCPYLTTKLHRGRGTRPVVINPPAPEFAIVFSEGYRQRI